jgi:nitric oxide reductase NorD protein
MRLTPASPMRRRVRVLVARATRMPERVVATIASRMRRGPAIVRLEEVHRRLELLLAAIYGRPIVVELPRPTRPSTFGRVARWASTRRRAPLAESDAVSIRLPATLSADDPAAALEQYRLLAVEQAERLVRGTAARASACTPMERDLFLLAESAAVDAAIAARMPGLRGALARSRSAAAMTRPPLGRLGPLERAVESLVRRVLAADPDAPPAELPHAVSPDDSLAWARDTAARLATPGVRYRGIAPVTVWGTIRDAAATGDGADHSGRMLADPLPAPPMSRMQGRRASSSQDPARSPDTLDAEGRTLDALATGAAVRDDQEGTADTASRIAGDELAGSSPGGLAEGDEASAPAPTEPPRGTGVPYDEWDHEASAYRRGRVVVRSAPAPAGERRWALDALRAHAAVVRQVRQRFERLRARRLRLDRQRDGDELDVTACVRALVDLRAGATPDDGLYLAVRPARRALAIVVLVDVSQSTEAVVDGALRVIDVERTSLLLASEALEALGDRHALLTFSGRGARDVRLTTIKDFGERGGAEVQARISAIHPDGNTRMGAALRHATHLLAQQPAGHRLLLILSDGRPNDVDGYHVDYGVEDTRRAVIEARARGVHPFCLTVDREAPAYLPHVFGLTGHTVLRDPRHLPAALLGAVQQLVRG